MRTPANSINGTLKFNRMTVPTLITTATATPAAATAVFASAFVHYTFQSNIGKKERIIK